MNGAESLLETLAEAGLEVCFANPGTSEMHLVSAIDRSSRVRSILALFEGVATGAADGYGRMAGKPAATLLHLGPGLGNGLANLHNARRARTPVLNIVGDHASYHLEFDAPLTSDVHGVAAPMSDWVGQSTSAGDLAARGAEAWAAASAPPGGVATLIVPADHAWSEAGGPAKPLAPAAAERADAAAIAAAARVLRERERVALILGGGALRTVGTTAAGRVRSATGAELLRETFTARVERGAGRVAIEPLPYFGEAAAARLEKFEAIVLAGAPPPVSFFGYPGKPSWLTPEGCELVTLAEPRQDPAAALEALAEELGAASEPAGEQRPGVPEVPEGALDPQKVAAAIACALPEGAIVSDESATAGALLPASTVGAPPHDWLNLTGGSIGQGNLALGRRGGRVSGPQGPLRARRRRRDVHAPGALDTGARRARRHDRDPREPFLRDPQHRAATRRRRHARPEGARDARPLQPRARLGEARRGHGGRGVARDHRGSLARPGARGPLGTGPAPRRSRALTSG